MQVAAAILNKNFLKGTHAIEFIITEEYIKKNDAYWIYQIIATDDDDGPILIERHRTFNSSISDPWPEWRIIRGSSYTRLGFSGLWLPHLPDLLRKCEIINLNKKDLPDNKKTIV